MLERTKAYIQESYDELTNKVTWPTWQELQESSLIVLVATVIISLVVLAMDQSSHIVLTTFYKLFK